MNKFTFTLVSKFQDSPEVSLISQSCAQVGN